jgi:hypothetical protein
MFIETLENDTILNLNCCIVLCLQLQLLPCAHWR